MGNLDTFKNKLKKSINKTGGDVKWGPNEGRCKVNLGIGRDNSNSIKGGFGYTFASLFASYRAGILELK